MTNRSTWRSSLCDCGNTEPDACEVCLCGALCPAVVYGATSARRQPERDPPAPLRLPSRDHDDAPRGRDSTQPRTDSRRPRRQDRPRSRRRSPPRAVLVLVRLRTLPHLLSPRLFHPGFPLRLGPLHLRHEDQTQARAQTPRGRRMPLGLLRALPLQPMRHHARFRAAPRPTPRATTSGRDRARRALVDGRRRRRRLAPRRQPRPARRTTRRPRVRPSVAGKDNDSRLGLGYTRTRARDARDDDEHDRVDD